MRRFALLSALLLLAACSNSKPVKRPDTPVPDNNTIINFSTYLGSTLADVVQDVAFDSAGDVYAVGGANSTDLLPGASVRAHAGGEDAFVAKLDGTTGQVVWWTFLGGPGPDRGYAIEIDPDDNVVIGGGAADQFPVTLGAVLTTFQGGAGDCDPTQLPTNTATVVPAAAECDVSTTDPARDGFVAKLSGATGALLWATYFGSGTFEANAYEQASFCQPNAGPFTTDDAITDFNDDADPRTSVVSDVAVDPVSGEIYLTFSVRSPLASFPDPDLVWGITNAGSDTQCDIVGTNGTGRPALIRNLPAVILAALQNGERPTLPGLNTGLGGIDGILAKLAPDGAALEWATYVGGSASESEIATVRLDPQGNPIVLFTTSSSVLVLTEDPVTREVDDDEPITTVGAFDSTNSPSDFYLAKYAMNGPLIWATFLGGTGSEAIASGNLAVRLDGTIVVAASTTSTNFTPPVNSSFDPTYNGGASDCAIATMSPDGDALLATTYYGGANGDGCAGVAADSDGRVYVTGGTSSPDLPLEGGPHQSVRPGAISAFLAVFSADLATLQHGGYFGGTGLGSSNALLIRADDTTDAQVVIAGSAGAGYPLSASPARGTVTAPPEHGVVSDLTIRLVP